MYEYIHNPDDLGSYARIVYREEKPPVLYSQYIVFIKQHATDFYGINYKGHPVGFILFFNGEFHAGIKKNHQRRWINKKAIALLKQALRKYKRLTTIVSFTKPEVIELCVRMGFKYPEITRYGVKMTMYPEDFKWA